MSYKISHLTLLLFLYLLLLMIKHAICTYININTIIESKYIITVLFIFMFLLYEYFYPRLLYVYIENIYKKSKIYTRNRNIELHFEKIMNIHRYILNEIS